MKKLAAIIVALTMVLPAYGRTNHKHHHNKVHYVNKVSSPKHNRKTEKIGCLRNTLCNIMVNMPDSSMIKVFNMYGVPEHKHRRLLTAIGRASIRHRLPKALIVTMIARESAFRSHAVSKAGAMGLMQIMPVHGVRKPFDIETNIDAGAKILSSYVNEADGNMKRGLARYGNGSAYITELQKTASHINSLS